MIDEFTRTIITILLIGILAFITRPPRRGLGQLGRGMDGF